MRIEPKKRGSDPIEKRENTRTHTKKRLSVLFSQNKKQQNFCTRVEQMKRRRIKKSKHQIKTRTSVAAAAREDRVRRWERGDSVAEAADSAAAAAAAQSSSADWLRKVDMRTGGGNPEGGPRTMGHSWPVRGAVIIGKEAADPSPKSSWSSLEIKCTFYNKN